MKFTASDTFNAYALSIAPSLQWNMYSRKTSTLSTSVTASGWTDITEYVSEIPDSTSNIEYELGQFTADNVTIVGNGIEYWTDNILNTAAGEYVELKITCKVGLNDTYADDVAVVFNGFVDDESYVYDEFLDTVTFDVFTQDFLGTRIDSLGVSTKYLNYDIAGNSSFVSGAALYNIPSVFVTQSQVPGYVLTPGIHTIKYTYDSKTGSLQLDAGAKVDITANGYYSLGDNKASASGDLQRVHVYVANINEVPRTDVQNDIIIISGSRYPNHWYVNTSAHDLFLKLFGQIGVNEVVADSMAITPYTGSKAISFLETPDYSLSQINNREALCVSGSELIVAIGGKVYKRTNTSPTASYQYLFGALGKIEKLWYNERNDDTWAYSVYGNTENYLYKYRASAGAVSAGVPMGSSNGISSYYNVDIVDYEYSAGNYTYGLVYCINDGLTSGSIYFFNGSSEVQSKIFNLEDLGYSTGDYFISAHAGATISGSNAYIFQLNGLSNRVHSVRIDDSGNWVTGSGLLNVLNEFYVNQFHSPTNRWYYYDTNGGTNNTGVRYINMATNTDTNVSTLTQFATTYVQAMTISGSEVIFSLWDYKYPNVYARNYEDYYIYSVNTTGNTVALLDKGAYAESTALVPYSGSIYGVDFYSGALFKIDSTLAMYVNEANFGTSTIKESLTNLSKAFNLITTVSPYKVGKISRRCDGAGDIVVLGTQIPFTITDDHVVNINKQRNQFKSFGAVKIVSNGNTVVYDGTKFNPTLPNGTEMLLVQNNLIPYYMMNDLAVTMYNFFATERHLYTMDLGFTPLFQYEPLDSCLVNVVRNMTVSGSVGVIYKTTFQRDGTFLLDFLV